MHPLFTPEESYDHINGSIKVDSIAAAYCAALKHLVNHGLDFRDERGDRMKTFWNLMVTIKRPLENLDELEDMHARGVLGYNRRFLDDYANQLIYGTMKPEMAIRRYSAPKRRGLTGKILDYFGLNGSTITVQEALLLIESNLGFAYTYFERLRKRWSRLSKNTFQSLEGTEVVDSEYIDQISEVIKLLVSNPNTRRAVCTTWIPSIDLKQENCPCLNWLDFYNINGELHLSVVFRSHDVFGAYVSNLYGLARLLEYVAVRTGLTVGTLNVLSANGHYNRLFEKEVLAIAKYK